MENYGLSDRPTSNLGVSISSTFAAPKVGIRRSAPVDVPRNSKQHLSRRILPQSFQLMEPSCLNFPASISPAKSPS